MEGRVLAGRTTLLFDCDGVLLDGEAVYVASWRRWAERHGLNPETVVAAMHGRRPAETIAETAPHLDIETEVAALAAGLAQQPPIPAMPGAVALLTSLPTRSWAIVTSSREQHIRRCFDTAGLPVPDVAVFSGDVKLGKPAPEGYLKAAAALGVDPSECVVVEDSPAGIEAGVAAGCVVFAVATTHAPQELARAHQVFGSLETAAPIVRAVAAVPA